MYFQLYAFYKRDAVTSLVVLCTEHGFHFASVVFWHSVVCVVVSVLL